MRAYRDALGNVIDSYQLDFYLSDAYEGAVFMADAIKRRGLYANVEVSDAPASSSVPVPMPNRDLLYFRLGTTAVGQLYFSSERVGHVVVNGDASSATAGGFVQGLLDQITTLALAK